MDVVNFILALPLACCMNFESALLFSDLDLSPVQSKEWQLSQSACAQDLLQTIGIYH